MDLCQIFEEVDDNLWAWNKLHEEVRHDPIKKRIAKIRANILTWMNGEIRKYVNERYKLLKIAKRTNRRKNSKHIRQKETQVTNLLREAEMKHWKETLQELRGKGTKSF